MTRCQGFWGREDEYLSQSEREQRAQGGRLLEWVLHQLIKMAEALGVLSTLVQTGKGLSWSASRLERFAFDQVHLIKGETQHNQWCACLGLPSIWFRLKAIRFRVVLVAGWCEEDGDARVVGGSAGGV